LPFARCRRRRQPRRRPFILSDATAAVTPMAPAHAAVGRHALPLAPLTRSVSHADALQATAVSRR
jgi:hypothetical protein